MEPTPSERRPMAVSARAFASFCLWAADCSLFFFSFWDYRGEGLVFFLGSGFCGLAFIAALVFLPLLVGQTLRLLPLAKPGAQLGGKAGSLVVEGSGAPMREALGWLPKLKLHETAAMSGLLSIFVLAAWGVLDYAAPDALAFKRLLLAAGALAPPLLLGRDLLRRRIIAT